MFYLKDAAIFLAMMGALFFLSQANPVFGGARDRVLKTLGNFAFFLGAFPLMSALLYSTDSFLRKSFWILAFVLALHFVRRRQEKNPENEVALWPLLRDKIRRLRGLNLLLSVYLGALFLLTFLLTLAPPSGEDYDSLVYHLAAPAQYLRHSRVLELPYDHHSYFPFTLEMMYLLGLNVSGPVLAKLFHWMMLPLCCAALFAMGRRHVSTQAGLWAAVLFASMPLVLAEATTAYIDLGFTFFVLMAFAAFLNWREKTADESWLWQSGAMVGFALGTKYLGALTAFWLGAAIAVSVLVAQRNASLSTQKNQWKPLAIFCGMALLLGGYWYVRNIAWTGNPVFPFAYGVFGGRGWTAEMAAAYDTSQAIYGFGKTPLDFLLLPFRMAFAPLNFDGASRTGLPFWPLLSTQVQGPHIGLFDVPAMVASSFVGPMLLALGVPALFLKNKPRAIRFIGWSFLFFFAVWMITSQQIRYLLPALALLGVPCGWAASRFLARAMPLKIATFIVLAAWMIFAPFYTWQRTLSTHAVAMGVETPNDYLNRTFAAYPVMLWANANTPPKARFAVWGEPRCFYLNRDYFWADDAHNNLIEYSAVKSAADLMQQLRAQKATHVLWNSIPEKNAGFGGPPPFFQDAIRAGKLKEIHGARGYFVYEIAR